MARPSKLLGVVLWIPAIVACASVLDIQTARHDPALDNGGADSGMGSLCNQYCDTVMASCTQGFEQYLSKPVCLKICAQLPPGSPADDAGNSVGCRLHYAQSAGLAGELGFNCPAAGPGGNGICGTNCEGLCTVDLKTCTGNNATYAFQQECLSACAAVPDIGNPTDGGTPVPYNTSIASGFSVQCRLYHLAAAQSDPALHCPHVAGNGKCSIAKP